MSYNVADLTSAVRDDLKDPSFNATRILRYLNQAQRKLFNTHLLDQSRVKITDTLSALDTGRPQEADWQATIDGLLTDPTNPSSYVRLNADNYLNPTEFFNRFPDVSVLTPGIPGNWTEFGGELLFNRPLDVPYSFVQRYYRAVPELTNNTPTDVPAVPEEFRELLETYALYKAEKYRGNHDVAATWLQEFEDGQESMNIRLNGVKRLVRGQQTRLVRPVHL